MAKVVSCPSRDDLQRFLVGRLPEAHTERLQQHLAGCPDCVKTLNTLETEDALVQAMRAQGKAAERTEDEVVEGLVAYLSGLSLPAPRGVHAGETQAYVPPPTTPAVAAPSGATPPSVAGYEVLGELGRGGMGVVYQARHLALKRIVALKMILAGGHAGPEHLARFKVEAESVARLQHPHVVQIYEVGEADGRPYCALEYVGGGSLAQKLGGTPLPPEQAAAIVETLARAMHVAHQNGVIHRDLKPANVLLTAEGAPKVTDFGLTRHLDEAGQTQSGTVMGTPSYMAPEQAEGRAHAMGPAVDVYALGAILYECLTGRPPFRAATALDTIHQVLRDDPVPPRQLQSKTPRDLETICLRCLHKEAARRYPSALALADDLRRFLKGEPIQARAVGRVEKTWRWCRRNPWAAALVVSLVAGTAVATVFGVVATGKEKEASAARALADDRLRLADSRGYVSRVRLAHRTWEDGLWDQAQRLLDSVRPEQTGNIDLRGWEWYYLNRLCKRSGPFVSHGTATRVHAVAFSPDGRLLASGGDDKTLRISDAQSGRELHVLKGHPIGVHAVAFSRDGQRVASADVAVHIWDVSSGRRLQTLQVPLPAARALNGVDFSLDGKRVAAGGNNGRVFVWDVETGKVVLDLGGHSPVTRSLAYSPDGSLLASCGEDPWIKLWDPATGQLVRQVRGSWKVLSLAFHPGGRLLASGGWDGRVHIWDTFTGQELFNLAGHESQDILAVAFSPDGGRLASSGGDTAIRIWDLARAHGTITLRGNIHGSSSLAFSRDGNSLASGNFDGVMLWDAHQDQQALTIREPSQTNYACFSPDGRRLAVCREDGWVHIRDGGTGRMVLPIRAHPDRVQSLAFSPDGQRLFSTGWEGRIHLWDVARGKLLLSLKGHSGLVGCAVFSPDGKRVASAGEDKTVRLWDAATGQQLRLLAGHTDRISSVAFSPDGRRLVSVSGDNTARVWDLESGETLLTFKEHEDLVGCVAFSPDGREVATGSADFTVKIWDPNTGRVRLTLKGHRTRMYGLAWHPGGKRLVTAGNDHSVRFWDTDSGEEVLTLKAHNLPVRSVSFTPDGHRLASCSDDGTVKVWDADPDREPTRPGSPSNGNGGVGSPSSIEPLVAPSEPAPFVILASGQAAERSSATLAGAMALARSGDVIEIRGNGPFVTPALNLGTRALVIRAGAGFQPVLQIDPNSLETNLPLLTSHGPLVLEGLHFRHVEAAPGKENYYNLVLCGGAPLRVTHCRFFIKGNRYISALVTWRSPRMEVRHCEFAGAFHKAINWANLGSFSRLEVADCLCWGADHFVGSDHFPPNVPRDIAVQMQRNTFVGYEVFALYHQGLPDPPADPGLRPFRFDVRENVLDAGVLLRLTVPLGGEFRPDVDRTLLPRCLAWSESKNRYGGHLLHFGHHADRYVDVPVLQKLEDWQRYWDLGVTGSVQGRPHYQGGDARALKAEAREKLTAADFRLHPMSVGQGAGASDLGADVDTVGPGKAYEQWKQTPAYREWVAVTHQPGEPEPFVVMLPGGEREFPYATLANAIQVAQSGDVIEVRGDGPFITEPIKIGSKALALRAGKGVAPVIRLSEAAVKAGATLLETSGPLTVEGLEFHSVGTNVPPASQERSLLVSRRAPLHLAHCRFLLKGRSLQAVEAAGTPRCEVRHCFFTGESPRALHWVRPPGGHLTVENCLIATPSIGLSVRQVGTDSGEASIRLVRNTILADVPLNFVFIEADTSTSPSAVRPTLLEASGNLFDARVVALHHEVSRERRPLEFKAGQARLRELLEWRDRRNLYRVVEEYLTIQQEPAPLQIAKGLQAMSEWHAFWGAKDPGSLQDQPRYQAPRLGARDVSRPEELRPEDFRLQPGSPGRGAGEGGRDLGATADLVGPGPAHDYWKRTSEYREWLKTTGQRP